ncbi:MAG: hypothetical protein GQ564_15390 [Bacteroidales bacterium]|nr:hypothetical protein [Bacteroidales bacterium]
MKTQMKSILVIAVLLVTASAFAQQGNRKQPTTEDRLIHVISAIEKKIEITDSQKEVIEKAYTDFFTQAENERSKGQRPDKSVMDNYEKQRDNKIKKVLTQEQYEEYLKVSCQFRPRPQKQGQRPPKQN